ncbi:MAG TPA: SRPBCC family protein [Acidimicrobiales bacterium]|nr:SRPBCC family protein [Acidimicrobiales bacterium]
MTETLRIADGRSVLQLERRLPHPVDKVWRAVTEPAHLAVWFPCAVEIPDLVVGGKLRFVFAHDEGPTLDGEITELDPPRAFGFTWDDNLLRIELRPDGTGCVLTFSHTFDDGAGAASLAAGWDTCLATLDTLLHDEPITPPARDAMDSLHETYVATFGLDQGTVDDTADGGWRVRFERQLVRPAKIVWAVVLDGAPAPAAGDPVPAGFTLPPIDAGPVGSVEAPTSLAYDWLHDGQVAGRVEWQLTTGTGHGARLILTLTGPASLPEARATALAAGRTHVESLAHRLLTADR